MMNYTCNTASVSDEDAQDGAFITYSGRLTHKRWSAVTIYNIGALKPRQYVRLYLS